MKPDADDRDVKLPLWLALYCGTLGAGFVLFVVAAWQRTNREGGASDAIVYTGIVLVLLPILACIGSFLIHDCLIHFKLPMLHKENADLKGSKVTKFSHPTTEGDIELVLRECDSGQVEGKQPNKRTHWLKTFCSFLAFIRDR